MRKWSIIAAVAAFAIFAVADLVHDFVTNDPIGYFCTEPHRLLYVAAIAMTGGLVALGFSRLSPRGQRNVGTLTWGAAAIIMTCFIAYFAFRFLSLASFIGDSGSTMWILALLLSSFGLAGYFWFEFCRAWKRGFCS